MAKRDTSGSAKFSLFNHSSLAVPTTLGATGSAVGSVHDSSFVALLPWLGLLDFNVGQLVAHMMRLGSVNWADVDVEVRTLPMRLVVVVFPWVGSSVTKVLYP